MSDPFVADCSIAFGWVHPSQATELTKRLLEEVKTGAPFHVPSIWHLEVANGLSVRRKLMTEEQRQTALTLLGGLPVIVDHETSNFAFGAVSELAAKHSLSAYGAAYLGLAQRKSLPLASRDEPLRAAAKRTGVKLL